MFAACSDEERLWYEFFLMTGMREQEVMFTYCVYGPVSLRATALFNRQSGTAVGLFLELSFRHPETTVKRTRACEQFYFLQKPAKCT
jgi:hypothetical protein